MLQGMAFTDKSMSVIIGHSTFIWHKCIVVLPRCTASPYDECETSQKAENLEQDWQQNKRKHIDTSLTKCLELQELSLGSPNPWLYILGVCKYCELHGVPFHVPKSPGIGFRWPVTLCRKGSRENGWMNYIKRKTWPWLCLW